jgi:CBS domain-containing protein
VDYLAPVPEYYSRSELALKSGESVADGFQVERPDLARVEDIMTPVVLSVKPDDSASEVVKNMLAWRVHRVFVVENSGTLVGVISTVDILRHLAQP